MQLTLLAVNLEASKNPSVNDLNEVEKIILDHDRPEIFSAYFSQNVDYLNLKADQIYGNLSENEEEYLKQKYLNDGSLREHAAELLAGQDYVEAFHELNEFVNTSKEGCHPIERIIEAVSDSSYHQTGFNQKDFFRNLIDQFGGLSEVLKHFSEDEVENALENC